MAEEVVKLEAESTKPAAAFPCTMAPGIVRLSDAVSVKVRRLRSSDYARAMAAAGVRPEEMAAGGGPRAALMAMTLARMALVSVSGLSDVKHGPGFKPERDADLGPCAPMSIIDDLQELCPGADESGGAIAAIVAEALAAMAPGSEAEKK